MRIIPIPLFDDNYSYFVQSKNPKESMLVDPAESKSILSALEAFPEYQISTILLTHKHWDHVGDMAVLASKLSELYGKQIQIVASKTDNIKGTTKVIDGQESFNIEEIKITAIPTPCHTMGALCFYLEDQTKKETKNGQANHTKQGTDCTRCVFTGDTHFIGGCGRFFEGTAEMMQENMEKLATLPGDTFVYPGHEYTVSNLKWAQGIEWENKAYATKQKQVEELLSQGKFSCPSTIAEEVDINIFWRTKEGILQDKLGEKDPAKVMGILRTMKDNKKILSQ